MSYIHNICDNLIKKYNLFWQYPVITEKTVFQQQKKNENFIGLPWATIIDKNINISNLIKELKTKLKEDNKYITCCQHINFKKIIDYLSQINIDILYVPHKTKNIDKINNIIIKSCPLYAVNLENNKRNKEFMNVDFNEQKRKVLYSFIGSYQSIYISKIRIFLLKMKHPNNCIVNYSGEWHFQKEVYHKQVMNKNINITDKVKNLSKCKLYNKVLLNSKYSLCPSGSGPNSIRFWESLGVGSIPILLADTLDLPFHNLWEKAILVVNEKDYKNIPSLLSKITVEKEKDMRKNCLKIYNDFKNNFLQI